MSTLLNLRVEACLKTGEVVFGEVAKMNESELVLRIRQLEVNRSPPHNQSVMTINQDDIIQVRPIGGQGHRVPAERDPAIVVAEEVNGSKTKTESQRINHNNSMARGKSRNLGRGARYQPDQVRQNQSGGSNQRPTNRVRRFFNTHQRPNANEQSEGTADRESRSIPRRMSSRVVANEMLDNNIVIPIMCPPREANTSDANRPLSLLRRRFRQSFPGQRRRRSQKMNGKGIQYNQEDVYDLDQAMQNHVEQNVFEGLKTDETPATSYERDGFYDFLNRHPTSLANSTRVKQQQQQQQQPQSNDADTNEAVAHDS